MINIYADRLNKLGDRTRIHLSDLVPGIELPETHADMFKNLDSFIETIPEEQRYNLHYDIALSDTEQDILPIDIDGIVEIKELYLSDKSAFKSLCFKYMNTVAEHFKIDPRKMGVIYSGNGLHLLIQTDYIFQVTTISSLREVFVGICAELNYALAIENLSGMVDTQPLRTKGTLRLPKTLNKKIDREGNESVSESEILQAPQKQFVSMDTLQQPVEREQYARPDTKAVLTGCAFLENCRINPTEVNRAQWFHMAGALKFLDSGANLVHAYSAKDTVRYNKKETDDLLRGWNAPPPRCSSIAKIFPGCTSCKHYAKDSTPVSLKEEESRVTIARAQQFRELIPQKDGTVKRGRVLYDELVEFFIYDQGTYVVIEDTKDVYVYMNTHYEKLSDQVIKAWSKDYVINFDSKVADEFLKILCLDIKRLVTRKIFDNQISGKVNFSNGVLHTDNGTFTEHSPSFYFTSTLPMAYSKDAVAPMFKKLLNDVTSGNASIQAVIMEFFGMTLANAPSSVVQKSLFITGNGSTGKSTLLNILAAALGGDDNISGVRIKDFNNSNYISSMVGKTANIVYEMGPNELRNCQEEFKEIVAGDPVFIRELYRNGTKVAINSKIIVACNTLPAVDDSTSGVFRRMIIVPFSASFTKERGNMDRNIVQKITSKELPGIINLLLASWTSFKNNEFNFTESEVIESTIESFKSMNPIIGFCEEELVIDKAILEGAKAKEIYERYVTHCRESGRSPKNRAQFTSDIAVQIASQVGVNVVDVKFKSNNGNYTMLRYVKLNENESMF